MNFARIIPSQRKYSSLTIACEHCGERIWLDDNAGSDNMPLCQRCYDDYYTTCECCGRIIHRDYALIATLELVDAICDMVLTYTYS